MKYMVIKCVNGNFEINSETDNLIQAKTQFHGLAQSLWNAPDVNTAKIALMDESLNVVEDYREFIAHNSLEINQ